MILLKIPFFGGTNPTGKTPMFGGLKAAGSSNNSLNYNWFCCLLVSSSCLPRCHAIHHPLQLTKFFTECFFNFEKQQHFPKV